MFKLKNKKRWFGTYNIKGKGNYKIVNVLSKAHPFVMQASLESENKGSNVLILFYKELNRSEWELFEKNTVGKS